MSNTFNRNNILGSLRNGYFIKTQIIDLLNYSVIALNNRNQEGFNQAMISLKRLAATAKASGGEGLKVGMFIDALVARICESDYRKLYIKREFYGVYISQLLCRLRETL